VSAIQISEELSGTDPFGGAAAGDALGLRVEHGAPVSSLEERSEHPSCR
jgi:hypothetical protein